MCPSRDGRGGVSTPHSHGKEGEAGGHAGSGPPSPKGEWGGAGQGVQLGHAFYYKVVVVSRGLG